MSTEPDTARRTALPDRFYGPTGAIYRGVLAGTLTALVYLVVLATYLTTTTAEVIAPTRAGYPLLWFVVAAAAVAAVTAVSDAPSGNGRSDAPDETANGDQIGSDPARDARSSLVSSIRRPPHPRWPLVVAGGYVLLLAAVSGLISFGATGFGVSVTGALPGWGPVVLADIGVVGLAIVPFQAVGYTVLGVLLARALTVRSASLAAGVVGLFSCAGCLLPIVAAVASAGGVPLFDGLGSYRLSTVAFVTAAVLLAGVVVRGVGSCRR
ncbi:MAG: hypothetical protein PPP55_06290 [Halorubrum sp.]